MPMKWLEGGRDERRDRIQAQPFAGDAALRVGGIRRVRIYEPPAADRSREIHRVVAVSFPLDWRGNRLGDVPLFTVNEIHCLGRIDRNFPRMLLSLGQAEVAQW